MNIEDKRQTKLVKLDTLQIGDIFCLVDDDGQEYIPLLLLDKSSLTQGHRVTLDEEYENCYICASLEFGWIKFLNKEEYVEPLYSKLIISVNEADIK